MNLDELEQERPKHRAFRWDENAQAMVPLDVTKQVFGAKDYISRSDERYVCCDGCERTCWAMVGSKCECGGTRVLYTMRKQKALPPGHPMEDPKLVDPRMQVIGDKPKDAIRIPEDCNAISGNWGMCERGTVGCTNHRRAAAGKFFKCYINHVDNLCKCSQPIIVDHVMLDNAESAALHVIGALKPTATSTKLSREDLDYLAISVTVMMAHWARKALGHKPEDERG